MLIVDIGTVDTGVVRFFGQPGSTAEVYPAAMNVSAGEIILEAVPAPGYQFDRWTGDVESEDNPLTLMIDCTTLVRANFNLLRHTLTMQVEGSGSIQPAIGDHEYLPETVVEVTAVAEDGWQFDDWTGDVADPASAITTVTVTADMTVAASFSQIMHTLMVELSGSGTTTPADGIHDYAEGSVVEIKAVAEDGWYFDSWTGDVADVLSATTTVTMASDAAVAALFQRSLTMYWAIGGGVAAAAAIGAFVWLRIRRRRA